MTPSGEMDDGLVYATWNRRFPGFGILAFRHGWIIDIGPEHRPVWVSLGVGRSWPWLEFLDVGRRSIVGGTTDESRDR